MTADLPELPRGLRGRRRRVSLSSDRLVELSLLKTGSPLPLLVGPAADAVDVASWARAHRELLQSKLSTHGGLLFRGFGIASIETFVDLIHAVSDGELLEYQYASTPRQRVSGRVYTSTEYPAEQAIPLHNEMSYQRTWPMKAWFYCARPAEVGGETPLADSRRVYEGIAPRIREVFARRGVQYVRNYGGELDLPWQAVFQTEDKRRVEAFCQEAGIRVEWGKGERLRTTQACQGVAHHPRSGVPVWFNQAHLFHVSSLEPELRSVLLANRDERDLPRNAYYGDGSAIEPLVLEEIREVYRREEVSFSWEEGDVLLLDNMLSAHGRRPYAGERRIRVGLTEPHRETDD